jgi:hypothetical protein
VLASRSPVAALLLGHQLLEAREHLVLLFTSMMLHVPLEIGHAIVDTGLVRSCVLEAG